MWISNPANYSNFYIGLSFPNAYDFSEHQKLIIKEHKTTVFEQGTKYYPPEELLTPNERIQLDENRKKGKAVILKLWACLAFDNNPTSAWYWSDDLPTKDNVIIRVTNGFILVHQSCVEVLKKFRIGKNRFIPLPMYEYGTEKLLSEDEWYFFELSDWRSFFIPELSNPACKPQPRLIYDKGGYLAHKILSFEHSKELGGEVYAMSKEASDCDLDLWHDPQANKSICVSDALKQALEDAGMADTWYFQSCLLVG